MWDHIFHCRRLKNFLDNGGGNGWQRRREYIWEGCRNIHCSDEWRHSVVRISKTLEAVPAAFHHVSWEVMLAVRQWVTGDTSLKPKKNRYRTVLTCKSQSVIGLLFHTAHRHCCLLPGNVESACETPFRPAWLTFDSKSLMWCSKRRERTFGK